MRLSTKVFVSSFLILSVSVGILGVLFYNFEKDRVLKEYDNRHKLLIDIISASLKRYEIAAEAKAKNALLYLSTYEKTNGLPDNAKLKALANELSITNFYVTDKNGFFIRNTEEEKNSVPEGLFSFCPGYRNLTYGNTKIEKTPIIPSYPYFLPFKFFMIPNHDRTKVLEAGMHFEDFGSVLGSAVESSEDFVSISLYTPTGDVLGHYTKGVGVIASDIENKNAAREKLIIPPPIKSSSEDFISHTSKIYSDIENCCECSVKNLLDNNKYYYYLKTTASTKSLTSTLASIRNKLFLIITSLLFFVYFLSKWIVRAHLKSFQEVITYISQLNLKKLTDKRLDTSSGDQETKQLAIAINHMVDELKTSNEAIEKASASEAYYKLSRQVAHDIRSPLMALKILEESLGDIADDKRALLQRILSRISEILGGLRKTTLIPNESSKIQIFNLSAFLLVIINEKSLLLTNRKKVKLTFNPEPAHLDIYVQAEPIELSRALSNLIDNAIESIDSIGEISVAIRVSANLIQITITDTGIGIPSNLIEKVGTEGFSHGKNGSGLGFAQALKTINKIGGEITITSKSNTGTTVAINLPLCQPPKWHLKSIEIKNKIVALIDDDKNVLSTWKSHPKFPESLEIHFFENTIDFLTQKNTYKDKKNTLVICDYNFGSIGNSLSFIEEHGDSLNLILSTNMFDDKNVITICESKGIPMVPKPIIPYIDIQ